VITGKLVQLQMSSLAGGACKWLSNLQGLLFSAGPGWQLGLAKGGTDRRPGKAKGVWALSNPSSSLVDPCPARAHSAARGMPGEFHP